MVQALKDVLIEAGEIDRYFDGHAPVPLWRARKKDATTGIFELVEKEVVREGRRPRPADITIKPVDGEDWVFVKNFPRGLSTFDKPRVFRGRSWEYYRIEAGTELPHGLAIVRDGYNRAYGAHHYTIAPAWDMKLADFKKLLTILAKSLIKEAA